MVLTAASFKNTVIIWLLQELPEKSYNKLLTLYTIDNHFDASTTDSTVGKGEIARNEQFLLFPQCFILR